MAEADFFAPYFEQIEAARSGSPESARLRQMVIAESLRMAEQPQEKVSFPRMYSEQEGTDTYNRMNRDRRMGQIFQASGDRPLGSLGKTMAAQDPERFKADLARQEQVRRYQEWQANQGGQDRRLIGLSKALDVMQTGEGENLYRGRMPSGVMEEVSQNAGVLKSIGEVRSEFKPKYAEVASQMVPLLKGYSGPFEGIAGYVRTKLPALMPEATEKDIDETARWWAKLYATAKAPERNKLFGATLTPPEKQAFEELFNIAPGMSPEAILGSVTALQDRTLKKAKDYVVGSLGVYGPGHATWMAEQYGDALSGGAPAPTAPAGPQEITVEPATAAPAPAQSLGLPQATGRAQPGLPKGWSLVPEAPQ